MEKDVKMFIEIPKDGYHFNASGIKTISEKYNARYMGCWCTQRKDGSWNEVPIDVFYDANPNRDLGHSNYIGVYIQASGHEEHGRHVYITDAKSAFSEPMTGSVCDDGEVIVSRYRHDYVEKKGAMIDGGRDYAKTNGCKTVSVTIDGPNFIFGEV
jgi:hypothetical protein